MISRQYTILDTSDAKSPFKFNEIHRINHQRSYTNKATMTMMGRHAILPTYVSLLLLAVLGSIEAWSAKILSSRTSRSQLHAVKESSIDESTASQSPSIPPSSSRRAFLCQDAPSAIGAASFLSCLLGDARSSVAAEEEEEDLIDVYFGCGEFLSFIVSLLFLSF